MSIWTSLFTGSSGVGAYGDAISVVGDNIANVSTTGYKSSRAGFADVLGGTAGNGQREGAGVSMNGPETLFGQGSLQQTGQPLDMAINGQGFFVVHGKHDAVDGNFYTRDGSFHQDNNGDVANADGLKLQGYLLDPAGNPSPTAGDLHLDELTPGKATSTVDMTVRLDSRAPTNGPPFDPLNPAATSAFTTSTTVFDSLGASHRVDIYFHANPNGSYDWHAMADSSEITGGTPGTTTEIGTGRVGFTPDGLLDTEQTSLSTANFVNATQGQNINFDFGSSITTDGGTGSGSMMAAADSLVQANSTDGYASGSLAEVSVGQDGMVTAKYSNGQAHDIARVALATFTNEQGLERSGGQLYSQTNASGDPAVGLAGSGSRGSIVGGALEGSNVDLGNELVTLIAYQRAFQANSKTVTTADEMLQEVANLKR